MTKPAREYNYALGRRSRPRSDAQMRLVLQKLELALDHSGDVRDLHRHRDLKGRGRDLQMARSAIDAAMIPARQELGRLARDPVRNHKFGDRLRRGSKRAQVERRLLRKMLGELR